MNMASIKSHAWPGSTAGTTLWRRVGLVGFTFFFLKGMLWLLLPLGLYVIG